MNRSRRSRQRARNCGVREWTHLTGVVHLFALHIFGQPVNWLTENMQCEKVNYTCQVCPFTDPAVPCPLATPPTPVHFDSRNGLISIYSTLQTGTQGYVHNASNVAFVSGM